MKFRRRSLILAAATVVACGAPEADEAAGDRAGEAAFHSASTAGSETIVLTVPSMSCPLCARAIEGRLREAGARDVRIDLETKRVTATFDPSGITAAEVKALVEEQGFPVTEYRLVDVTAEEGAVSDGPVLR